MNTPTGKAPRKKQKRPGTRRSRSIRFSDSEWRLVEQAASRHGMPAGEFVRSEVLAAAEEGPPVSPGISPSSGHGVLIEAIYRAVYVLATINREELIAAGRREDIDRIVAAAQDALTKTMEGGPG